MTRVQLRVGDQSAIVDGEGLIISLQGLFKLEAVDDTVILEVPRLNAEPAFQSDGHFETGQNIWNGYIQSDAPNKRGPYRVNLYRVGDLIRGTCQCMDWHLQGLGHGDLTYKCKHIVTALQKERLEKRLTS